MKNKKAWLKIIEATIAILIITGILLVSFSKTRNQPDISQELYEIESRILNNIASRSDLRTKVLKENETYIEEVIRNQIPQYLNFTVRICNLTLPSCNMYYIIDKEIYVEERIISSNLTLYEPKKVRLFVWEK